jgi:hypothetical protein
MIAGISRRCTNLAIIFFSSLSLVDHPGDLLNENRLWCLPGMGVESAAPPVTYACRKRHSAGVTGIK